MLRIFDNFTIYVNFFILSLGNDFFHLWALLALICGTVHIAKTQTCSIRQGNLLGLT